MVVLLIYIYIYIYIGDNYGIDGTTGKIVDVSSIGIWDPVSVKMQTIKSALEVCCMLLRIDDVVSGLKKEKQKPSQMQPQPGQGGPDEETVIYIYMNIVIVWRCTRRINEEI